MSATVVFAEAAMDGFALRAGWRVDHDLWFTRKLRPGDLNLNAVKEETCHFGFITVDEVFVRNGACALAYDRGEVIPYDVAHQQNHT